MKHLWHCQTVNAVIFQLSIITIQKRKLIERMNSSDYKVGQFISARTNEDVLERFQIISVKEKYLYLTSAEYENDGTWIANKSDNPLVASRLSKQDEGKHS